MAPVSVTTPEKANPLPKLSGSIEDDEPSKRVQSNIELRLPQIPRRFSERFNSQHLRMPKGAIPAERDHSPVRGLRAAQGNYQHLEGYWRELTGRTAQESQFTLIVPVYNEARLLPATLHCLSRSNIPPSVPLQVVFVTNASTDGSGMIIQRRIDRLYGAGNTHTPDVVSTIDAKARSSVATYGEIRIVHLQTPTPGKANALNLGDALARQRGHTVSICIDADSFVEPDTIGRLYADAIRLGLGEPSSNVVAVAGSVQFALPPDRRKPSRVIERLARICTTQLTPPRDGHIWGSCWAWNPEWLYQRGGHPTSVIEDMATAAHAFLDGKRVVTSQAATWALFPGSLADYGRQQSRFAKGIHQLRAEVGEERFRQLRELLGDWYWSPKSAFERVKALLLPRLMNAPIQRWPRVLARFALEEYWRVRGARQFKRQPECSTWERIDSTK